MAALHRRLDCLKMLIEKFKVSVNVASVTGWRPIHLVISKEGGSTALDCLQYLIGKGADINVQNHAGVSPLHKAASEGHEMCVKALIDAGANVHATDGEGHMPIDVCRMWGSKTCARYLASAMWKRDKANLAREVFRLNAIKAECEKRQREFLRREQRELDIFNSLAFEKWLAKKNFPLPSGRILGLLESRRPLSVALQKYTGKTASLASCASRTLARAAGFDPGMPQRSRRRESWNGSPNPASVPVTCIARPVTVRLGVDPEEPQDHDFTSFLFLFRNAFGEPEIQVGNMEMVSDVPKLPFDVIARSLFPRMQGSRLEVPAGLRPAHLLDLKHRRPPGPEQVWTDQMAVSLRQTLDPAFLRALKAHLSTYADPSVLSPRGQSECASDRQAASTLGRGGHKC
ncbi:ankyrin repeat domain-containing protein 53 [Varanus komodoensis]|uniref:ankyrin repeat domain-containing protein 53 n=1 Tax=Varanus komodoensis TaxID=61221 RepID=UPI001CF78977|nr:ankyrin repeat domain-containing protein 53 [Varanus komodoensis]